MLVIHPDECIDCGVCVPECPAEAIFPDTDFPQDGDWLSINAEFANKWPNITKLKPPMEEADKMNGVTGKLADFFSSNPGKGD